MGKKVAAPERDQGFNSLLHQVVSSWCEVRGMTWATLFGQAGLSEAVGTDIRRGSKPREDTLRKLSIAMGLPLRDLLKSAGYDDAQISRLDQEVTWDLTEAEEVHIAAYRLLSEDGKAAVNDVVALILGRARVRGLALKVVEDLL